ncbi:MAG: TonB-dependent receptor [Gemmatimonadaceae bacterium]|nr:TonB-dependent receptor [Gemmatimonadaceae bacterium]
MFGFEFARRRAFHVLMRLPLAALCTLTLAAPVVAQSVAARREIRGVVVDNATAEPLAFARVRLLELHREVTTHEDGRFRFEALPTGPFTLVVQRIGYAPATRVLAAADTAALTLRLVRSAAQLAATVVTGAVDERTAADALSSTTVVSGAALDRRLEPTVSATLSGTPGFVATSVGPATARPVLRGLGGDRVLMLEDGLRTGDLSGTTSDHATAIEPASAKQIEVVRGPMSLLYGSNALGGVVNVVQEVVPTSLPDDAHGSLAVHGSSVQPGGGLTGVFTTARGRTALRLEASGRQAGDLRTPGGVMTNTGLGTYNAAIGVSRIGPEGHVGVALRTYFSSYGLPGGFTGAHPNGVDLRMFRNTARVEGERHPARGPFSSVRGSAQYTLYAHQELGAPGRVTVSFLQHVGALEAQARHGEVGPMASGAIGMRAQVRAVEIGGANRATDTGDWSLAAFAVQEFGRGRLRGQTGLRYEVAQFIPLDARRTVDVGGVLTPVRRRTFGSLSGSVGAQYELLDGVRVGATVAQAFRTPDFNELFSDGPHLAAYSYDVGNPEIRQERGLGTDVFVRVQRGIVSAELGVFRNELRDFIYARNTGEIGRQGFAPKFQYVNTDARFTGVDGSMSVALSPSWVVEGTLSSVWARRLNVMARDSVPATATPTDSFPAGPASQWLPWIPPVQGTIGTRWESRRWFAGATVRAAAAQPLTGDYERPTDGYAVLNVSAGVRLLVGSRLHALTLRLDNAGNTLYRDHLSRTKVVLPEAGRNLSLLYRITL